MENNKSSLFKRKKQTEINNEEIISQSANFNTEKYVKKWHTYWNTLSTDINYNNNWKIGNTVQIIETHDKFAGVKGKIDIGFSKDENMLCVRIKDGKKEMINKDFIRKISIFDYLED